MLVNTKNCIAEKETLGFRLLDQIQQLYRTLCKRNNNPPHLGRDQVEEMLDYIKLDMEFLGEILRVSKKKVAEEAQLQGRKPDEK